jgi:hypothetical protein
MEHKLLFSNSNQLIFGVPSMPQVPRTSGDLLKGIIHLLAICKKWDQSCELLAMFCDTTPLMVFILPLFLCVLSIHILSESEKSGGDLMNVILNILFLQRITKSFFYIFCLLFTSRMTSWMNL